MFSRHIAIGFNIICLLYAVVIQITLPEFFSGFLRPFIIFAFIGLLWVAQGQVRAFFSRRDSLAVMTLVGSFLIVVSASFDIISNLLDLEIRNMMQIGFTLNILLKIA